MTPTPSAQIGANIKAEMARRNVTQAQLGAALNLAQASISARLRGKKAITVDELHAIAAFLDVPLTALYAAPGEVAA